MRCAWEVTAGIVPGTPMPDYSRRWIITSECWEKMNSLSDEEFKREFPEGSFYLRFLEEAHNYAKELTQPQLLNWVRVEWIWL